MAEVVARGVEAKAEAKVQAAIPTGQALPATHLAAAEEIISHQNSSTYFPAAICLPTTEHSLRKA